MPLQYATLQANTQCGHSAHISNEAQNRSPALRGGPNQSSVNLRRCSMWRMLQAYTARGILAAQRASFAVDSALLSHLIWDASQPPLFVMNVLLSSLSRETRQQLQMPNAILPVLTVSLRCEHRFPVGARARLFRQPSSIEGVSARLQSIQSRIGSR